MEFEWDDAKAARNLRDHGIGFAQAAAACRDLFAVEWIDERHHDGEERVNLLGMCEGVILHVTYTECGQRVRMIPGRAGATT
jgi:uncharacterized DUF497 family protein